MNIQVIYYLKFLKKGPDLNNSLRGFLLFLILHLPRSLSVIFSVITAVMLCYVQSLHFPCRHGGRFVSKHLHLRALWLQTSCTFPSFCCNQGFKTLNFKYKNIWIVQCHVIREKSIQRPKRHANSNPFCHKLRIFHPHSTFKIREINRIQNQWHRSRDLGSNTDGTISNKASNQNFPILKTAASTISSMKPRSIPRTLGSSSKHLETRNFKHLPSCQVVLSVPPNRKNRNLYLLAPGKMLPEPFSFRIRAAVLMHFCPSCWFRWLKFRIFRCHHRRSVRTTGRDSVRTTSAKTF